MTTSEMLGDSSVWTDQERDGWSIPDAITPSAWAAERRILSATESPAEPGPWNPERAPYLNAIMDAAADPTIQRVVGIKVPQMGFSEAFRNVLGYWADEDPAPVLIVFPTEDSVRETITDHVLPMIRNTPALDRLRTGKASDEKTAVVKLSTMTIYTGWSNSAQSLASRPIRRVLLDEVGKYPRSTGKETNAIKLAEHRTTTFGERALVVIWSTPTIEDSLEWVEYEACPDKRTFRVPCPHCGTYQTLPFGRLRWAKPAEVIETVRELAYELSAEELGEELYRRHGLTVDPTTMDAEPDMILDDLGVPDPSDRQATADWVEGHQAAWVECAECDGHIEEHYKGDFLNRGVWASEEQTVSKDGTIHGKRPVSTRVGFRIWSLYSPWTTLWRVAAEWLRAQGDPSLLMDFVNARLAEPFRQQTTGIQIERFEHARARCAELVEDGKIPPAGVVPIWAGAVAMTADTQKDHFWYTVRAWGHGHRSKLLDYGRAEDFDALLRLLNGSWPIEGSTLRAATQLLLIDSGGSSGVEETDASRTEQVYQFSLMDSRIIPTKGNPSFVARPYFFSKIEKGRFRINLCLVNPNFHKDVLAARLEVERGQPGFYELNELIDDTYARQMTAQKKRAITKGPNRGRMRWELVRDGGDDHLFDCETLQQVAAAMLNVNLLPPEETIRKEREREERAIKTAADRAPSGRDWLHGGQGKTW